MTDRTIYFLLASALVSIAAVRWIFPKVLKIARLKDLVDNPDSRKLQTSPVPVLGGLAVFFGMVLGALCFAALNGGMLGAVPVLLASSVMLYVGMMDDIHGLSPFSRLFIETLAISGMIFGSGMCVDSLHGLWGVGTFSWWIAVPLTVFAGVGLINAYNMVDGVNGLSSGLCISCSVFLVIIFWLRHDYVDCALAFCFGAALIPFLLHNVFGKKSRMFIGDAGTMVMGTLVSWFMIRVLSGQNADSYAFDKSAPCLVALMIAIASVPVFDTLRVMTGRLFRGDSPFHADRTHLHHVFVALGVSHSITALSEILINIVVVASWFISYKCGLSIDLQFYITIIVAVALVWGTYFFLRYQETHDTKILHALQKVSVRTHLGHKNWWLKLQARLDKGAYESPDIHVSPED